MHLRTARQMRQAKGGTRKSGLGQIIDTVSICERPTEAEDRAVPGHWEGDLFSGANNTHIATLVERHTRFVMLLKVPSKDTATVVAAHRRLIRSIWSVYADYGTQWQEVAIPFRLPKND